MTYLMTYLMTYIPDEAWISIIKYLELKDLISICRVYDRIRNLCDEYPSHIYKEMLRVRGFNNFENFTVDTFLNFCKIDPALKLNVYNILYAYESGYIDVAKFLLNNKKVYNLNFYKLEMNKIAEYIHSYWSYQFKGIGYLLDESIQEELLIYLLDFNINKVKNIEIPNIIDKNSYGFKRIYSKIDFESMTSLFLHISVVKNDWGYVKNSLITFDIIGMQYYEDAY